MKILVAVFALTVSQLGQAETDQPGIVDQTVAQTRDTLGSLVEFITTPFVDFRVTKKDEECLAKNIFYEAGSESEEGKAAVGIVTINRVKDSRFGSSICSVVNQRTVFVKSKDIQKTETVQTGWFGRTESVTTHQVVTQQVPICQFSWVCALVRRPKTDDERWTESLRVAHELLDNGYEDYRIKYTNAIYFHAISVRPGWAYQKQRVARIGGHIFYADKN
jgi:spore germination cell wall hydrolase CwlJ-like protein